MMKYLILIGDGMSDYPLKQLGGKTPLQVAKTPNMDFLAQNGLCGWVNNVPKGMDPGSDVAAMSIFGCDPKKYYTGRGPLEAASLGVKLKPDEIAFRCNLVTIKDGKMESFTAHHISTVYARKICKVLNKGIGAKGIKFIPGLSYRNLLVMSKSKIQNPKSRLAGSRNTLDLIIRKSGQIQISNIKTTPPHDITGKRIHDYLPKGEGAQVLLRLMNESKVILAGMKTKATMIWPWGQGKAPQMPAFRKRFGKRAAVITAVHLLKGLGKVLGMEVIDVPGATGYLDTNYKGKAEYALRALKKNDVVFVHVEAPDEAGHEGDVKKKIRAIEDFDRLVVGTILKNIQLPTSNLKTKDERQTTNYKLLVLPDHPTPIKAMTHTSDAVPFVMYPSSVVSCQWLVNGYNEKEIGKTKFRIKAGNKLLEFLFRRDPLASRSCKMEKVAM